MSTAFGAIEVPEINSSTLIFIDEIDAIAPRGERTHGEVECRTFSWLDGNHLYVVIIAATNEANSIDPDLTIVFKGM